MRAENDKLSSEIQQYQSELKKLRDLNQGQRTAVKEWKDANTAKAVKLTRLKQTLQTASNELRQNRKQIYLKEQEIEKLEQKQRDSMAVQKNMNQKIAAMKEESERLKQEKQSVVAEKATLVAQITTMKSDWEGNEVKLKSLRALIESARSEQQKTEQQRREAQVCSTSNSSFRMDISLLTTARLTS